MSFTRKILYCLSAVILFSGCTQTQPQNTSPQSVPTEVESAVGCQRDSGKEYCKPEHYHMEPIPLGPGGVQGVLVTNDGYCGSGGCSFWLFEKFGARYRLLWESDDILQSYPPRAKHGAWPASRLADWLPAWISIGCFFL